MNQNSMHESADLVPVNVFQLLSHFKSKKEVYRFLVMECQAFLPKIESTNIYFFKQLVRGEKDEVKVSAVPQIEGLTVADFLSHAKKSAILLRYLPDQQDWNHVDKKWLCDLLYTLDTENISEIINMAVLRRKAHLEQSQDLVVNMRPEIAEALLHTSRGRSAFLLKESSHRKRTKRELEEVKDEESYLRHHHQTFLKETKRLKQNQEITNEEIKALSQYKDLVEHLHSQGVIDENGNPNIH